MQDICAWLTRVSRSSSGCSSMQGIYTWLTGGSICLLYISIVLDPAVGVVVCKTSVLDWLGGLDLAVGVAVCKALYYTRCDCGYASLVLWLGGLLYIWHCSRSSSGCSGMQDICAWLTRGSRSSSGCSSMQDIYTQLTGGYLPSIYIHCTRSSSGCSGMQSLYAWFTGGPSAFYIYALYYI